MRVKIVFRAKQQEWHKLDVNTHWDRRDARGLKWRESVHSWLNTSFVVGAGGSVQCGMEFEDFDQLKSQIYLKQVILQPGHANTQILLIPGISSDTLPDLHSGVVDWWIM